MEGNFSVPPVPGDCFLVASLDDVPFVCCVGRCESDLDDGECASLKPLAGFLGARSVFVDADIDCVDLEPESPTVTPG